MPLVRHVATMGGSGGRLPSYSASSRKSSGSPRVTLLLITLFAAFGLWAWSSYVNRIQDAIRRGAEEAEAVEAALEEQFLEANGEGSSRLELPPAHSHDLSPRQPPPSAAAAAEASSPCDAPSGLLGTPGLELDGGVVRAGSASDGSGLSSVETPQECCRACEALRGCNVWVHCSAPSSCAGQCWLKHQKDPRDPAVRGREGPWASGALLKAFVPPEDPLPAADTSIGAVVLSTSEGDIRLRLRPEWSVASVEYVRRVAAMGDDTCVRCELYRVEPGFLLQGVVASVIPANNVTTPGPKLMEMGDVGWAGGGPGPDFFIYLGENPASHFGTSHTVWAEVADAESLAAAKRIVGLPSHTPGGPGTMRFLQQKLDLRVNPAASPSLR